MGRGRSFPLSKCNGNGSRPPKARHLRTTFLSEMASLSPFPYMSSTCPKLIPCRFQTHVSASRLLHLLCPLTYQRDPSRGNQPMQSYTGVPLQARRASHLLIVETGFKPPLQKELPFHVYPTILGPLSRALD